MQKRDIGFTLIELLVSIGVIAVLATIVFVNFRSGNDILALERSAQKVVQDIRRTAGFALQGDQLVSCSSGTFSGYGVYFDSSNPTSYILFAECNGNDQYDAGQDELMETIPFEQNIELRSVAPVDPISIIFAPPDPAVTFSGGVSSSTIVVGIQGTPVSYEYRSGRVVFGWHPPNAWCDGPNSSLNCASSFSATANDLAAIYDWYCVGMPVNCSSPNRRSLEFRKTVGAGLGGIFVNEAGFPDTF